MTGTAPYVGRFAPSPTGPLHFGSLVAAVGSWLDARQAGGRWLLRLDDLDRPRNQPGADDAIARELVRLGLEWDAPALRQSDDEAPYHAAARALRERGAAFGCCCSRRDLVDGIYPGRCRSGLPLGAPERSLRLRVDDVPVAVDDAVQGSYSQRLQSEVGDFVVIRADGIVAYHLATVVDDAAAGVTHVVRGTDLLASTPRQIALQRVLGLATPAYAHLPLANNAEGRKLSKQTHAPATMGLDATGLWLSVLAFLGQCPPASLAGAPLKKVVDWALDHWTLQRVPATSPAARCDEVPS